MATNFPGSQDSFTNPTSGSSLSSPSHADQHTNVNDAVEAIETALLDGAPLHIDDTNERVGIGTASPSAELDVQGNISQGATGSNAGRLLIDNTTDTVQRVKISRGGASGQLAFHTGSDTEHVRITNTGNVGINDTTPSYTLDVNGDINTTGALRTDGKKTGLVLQASGDFSNVTGIDITNVFTSEFDNYQIHFSNVTNTGQEWIYFRFWQGGSLNSSNLYDNQRHYTHVTSVGGQKDVLISYGKLLPAGGNPSAWVSHISSPNLSNYTLVTSHGLYSDNTTLGYVEINNTFFRSTTAVTGIRFGGVSGSHYMTGRWEVYGCPK